LKPTHTLHHQLKDIRTNLQKDLWLAVVVEGFEGFGFLFLVAERQVDFRKVAVVVVIVVAQTLQKPAVPGHQKQLDSHQIPLVVVALVVAVEIEIASVVVGPVVVEPVVGVDWP